MLLRVPGFVGELGAFARGMEIQEIGHIVRVTVICVGTVRDWEQLRRTPDAPARTLLGMVNADPKAALALIEKGMG